MDSTSSKSVKTKPKSTSKRTGRELPGLPYKSSVIPGSKDDLNANPCAEAGCTTEGGTGNGGTGNTNGGGSKSGLGIRDYDDHPTEGLEPGVPTTGVCNKAIIRIFRAELRLENETLDWSRIDRLFEALAKDYEKSPSKG